MTLPRPLLAATICTVWGGFLAASAAAPTGAAAAYGPGGAAPAPGAPQGQQDTQSGASPNSPRPDRSGGESQAIAHSASTLARHRLRPGSHGSLVRTLQDLLSRSGLYVSKSGRFDRRTYRQLRRFQKAHGLPVTGISDSSTAMQLGAAAAAAASAGGRGGSGAADAGWVFPLTPLSTVTSPHSWSQDQGVDLGGAHGECGPQLEELAVASGTVVKLGIQGFGPYAPVIKLDSGPDAGRYVYYGHAAPALVTVGQHVAAGQPVAQVGCGTVGISSTPHLELGISQLGGPPCCPGRGATSGETLTQLKYAYKKARLHPQQPVAPTPLSPGAPPASNGAASAP